MSDSRETLKTLVYNAAKEDYSLLFLYSMLNNGYTKGDIVELLNEPYYEKDFSGQCCTPLIVAAKHGNHNVTKAIVCKFKVNLEVEGVVKFDGCIVKGATALWCAAAGGFLNVVKTLVKAGARVNHATQTKSTPVRAACYDGRLDIVKYLVDHKANIHTPNKYNNTCLMIASYKGHVDVVSYLLECNADPNVRALCGATALHFAAECGHLAIVEKLMKYNAEVCCVNDSGMTPLKAAAERVRKDVVEYIISNYPLSKEDQIEALELLGASYANDKENYSVQMAYHYLERAIELRFSDENNVIPKILLKPVPAYENWVETKSPDELRVRLSGNPNAIHMESLAIRERILGENNADLPHPIVYRGAVFADLARFDRCVELWLHAVNLRQTNNVNVSKDLLRFAQVFSQMLHVGVEVAYENLVAVMKLIVTELKRNKSKLREPDQKDDPEIIEQDYYSNINTALYLIAILARILNASKDDAADIHRHVYELCRMSLVNHMGQTLLHMACNAETPVDDFHIADICKFPCANTVALLLECGANVNITDIAGNTPLHVIVTYHKAISDFSTLHAIITKLTEAGVHCDSVNHNGDTAIDVAATGVAEIILKSLMKLCLKCIAARVVKRERIAYRGLVPNELAKFIELHGPPDFNYDED